MRWRHLLAVVVALGIGLAACSVTQTREAGTMRLTSPAFDDGAQIPAKYGCNGEGVSPPLAWTDVPDGTVSFVLVVSDPDANGFTHWLLTDVPADARELPEGEGDAVGVPHTNDFGDRGWGGPCPPSGEHRYVFTLYALSAPYEHGGVALDADGVRAAIRDKVTASGELTGTYRR